MRRLASASLLAAAALCSLWPSHAHADSPLVVVIDPGHGGPFPHDGAHGAHGLIEKSIALQVARRLRTVLEDAGATVLLTRDDDDLDVSLPDRVRFANESAADLFLSIHCNSMETRHDRAVTRGIESYFLSPDPTDAEAKMLAVLENGGPEAVPIPKSDNPVNGLLADLALGQARNDSASFAQMLHHALVRQSGAPSRGVRQAPFLVLSGTKMPSALIEIGFISHPAESRLLAKESYQQKVAEGLAQGVRDFARVLSRRLIPPTPEERAMLGAKRAAAARLRAQKEAAAETRINVATGAVEDPHAPARPPPDDAESPVAAPEQAR